MDSAKKQHISITPEHTDYCKQRITATEKYPLQVNHLRKRSCDFRHPSQPLTIYQQQQPPPRNHKRAHVRRSPSQQLTILNSPSALRSLTLPSHPSLAPLAPVPPQTDSPAESWERQTKEPELSPGKGWETGTQKQVPRSEEKMEKMLVQIVFVFFSSQLSIRQIFTAVENIHASYLNRTWSFIPKY